MLTKCLLVSSLLLASTRAYAPQCCQDGHRHVLDTKNCTDGLDVRLNCSFGMYAIRPVLEPEYSYHFTLDQNNATWLQFDGLASYNVSPTEYCITRTETDGDVAVLVCFPEAQYESLRPLWKTIFFGMSSTISSIFLALTLLVYLVLPELREVQDKAVMSMTLSFMFAFFFTSNQQLNASVLRDDSTCLLIAFLMYYAYMCAFFWLNVISLNICRSVWFPSFKVKRGALYAFYCFVGWGLPLCFLALAFIAHNYEDSYDLVKPGFGETSCWFSTPAATWSYFYGPITVLLSINLFYLALTGWKLWHQYRGLSCCKLKVLRLKCSMCVKLALLMGIPWIFEVMSYASGEPHRYYWILPDILNAFQGILMFIILVVCRKRVRKLLAQRQPFNIPFPKSWAAYADLEGCGDDEIVAPEELELSQSS